MDQDQLLTLIDNIYAAGMDANLWSSVLPQIARAMGAEEASLGMIAPGATPWLVAPHTDPDFLATYQTRFHPLNLFWHQVQRQAAGTIVTDDQVLDRDTLERSTFYNEWSAPQGYRYVAGTTLVQDRSLRIELQVPAKQRFGSDALRLLRILVPHLTRSTRIMHQLGGLSLSSDEVLSALHTIGQPAFILDKDCRLLGANALAEALLTAGHGIRAINGVVSAEVPSDTRILQKRIATCACNGLENNGPGDRLQLDRPSMGQPLLLLCGPIQTENRRWPARNTAVMVLVSDPLIAMTARTERLRQQFGLTAAEAALALEISRGDGRSAAARRRGISIATARSQLTSVFDKTGVRRQAELVRLILNQPD